MSVHPGLGMRTPRRPSPARHLLMAFLAAFFAGCDGVEQARSCQRYVACIRALDASLGRETDLERFDAGGACWGSEEGALLCERACTRGIEWYSTQPGAPAECQP